MIDFNLGSQHARWWRNLIESRYSDCKNM